MKFAIVVFSFCILAVAKAQFFGDYESFGGFGGGLDSPLQATRDPRQNPGPVVFPPAPPDNGETSGVVVGASGYGFVPPGHKLEPELHQNRVIIPVQRYRLVRVLHLLLLFVLILKLKGFSSQYFAFF